ncbi:MAG: hypothetical protein WBB23_08440 [Desulforhopalus sp.]
MAAKITFFPVGNGDMTLVDTDVGKKILIDCNIRAAEDCPDVVKQLRERLSRDSSDRLFIDVFIWSHTDEDHCRGISEHFHLGSPEDWSEKKDLIFIREIWSSPIVFRRASKNNTLSQDAKDLNKEVKRRVNKYKDGNMMVVGDYVTILAEDENGKTDDIKEIVLNLDDYTSKINGKTDTSFGAKLLGPSAKSELEEDEEKLGKNHSSVILNIELSAGNTMAKFLTGGDAEVVCWETLLQRMKDKKTIADLDYNVMQAPHHCSWHTLSHESWSGAKKEGKTAKPSDDALEALGYALDDAIIISSSNSIKDEDSDPPSSAAKDEYLKILEDVNGSFKCVSDNIKDDENVPLEIEITSTGGIKTLSLSLLTIGGTPSKAVNREGGDTYA